MVFEDVQGGKALSWKEFRELVEKDADDTRRERYNNEYFYISDFVYRGQSRSDWLLKTSLERFLEDFQGGSIEKNDVKNYYSVLSSIVPVVNSLSGTSFTVDSYSRDVRRPLFSLPSLELLYFVRHLGFPSPLLDWSESFYVASFFAFRHARAEGGNVAVYALQPYTGGADAWHAYDAKLYFHGSNVQTHERNFRQKSCYTAAISTYGESDYFVRHEDARALLDKESRFSQVLKKYTLDAREKWRVLEELDQMNINEYTLFNTPEGLMSQLALSTFKYFR